MDGLVSVCHFCEQHGPSVVFCTQSHQQLPSHDQLQLARGCSSVNSDECAACRAYSMEKGCFVTESSSVCYISSRVPLSAGVASLLHRACVRSLSCEVCPGGEGCVYFGDDVRGHALSYIFSLRDVQARGLKRWFSLVVLVKEQAYLLSAWTFLVHHLQQMVQLLQERALQVFNKEGGSNRRVQTELPHRQKTSVRGLSDLVASPLIWKRLHTANVWLMASAGARLVEVMAPACDPFTSAAIDPDYDSPTPADDETILVGSKKWSVESAVDVARDVDGLETNMKRDIDGCENGKDKRSSSKTGAEVSRNSREFKRDGNSSRQDSAEADRIDTENTRRTERLGVIKNHNINKKSSGSKMSPDEALLERSSGVNEDKNSNDAIVIDNRIESQLFGTPSTENISGIMKFVPVNHTNNSSQDVHSINIRQQSTEDSSHDQMCENSPTADAETAKDSLCLGEVLTLRKVREVLGGDQFGILLQHLLLGFPLLIQCVQDGSAATVASSLLRAVRSVLPYFLHGLVSVTNEKSPNSDQVENVGHSDLLRKTSNDSPQKISSEEEKRKLSESRKVYDGRSSTLIPTSANYFRLPSSPSIEAYDALEIDTLVLVVTAPPESDPTNIKESNLSMCRNISYASLPKDCSDVQTSNFQSSGSKSFNSRSTDRATYNTSSDFDRQAWKFQQFIKRCKFQLEDVSGRPYFGSCAVAFAADALHRDWCTLVRTIISACTNSALRDDTLQLTVHHALLSWCSKAKLWDSLLAEQRSSAANGGTWQSTPVATAADRPVSPKPKTSFGFSLSPPLWPKFLTSSRPKKQTDASPQKRDKQCDRYEAVGLYPSLCDSSAMGDDYSFAETSKVGERSSQSSSAPVSISSGDKSSKSILQSNSTVTTGSQPPVLNRAPDPSHSYGYYESTTKGLRKSSTLSSSPLHLSGQSSGSSLLKPEILKAKLDSQGRRVNKLYPSISEEDLSMPNSYNVHESHAQGLDPELLIHSVPSQGSLGTSALGPSIFAPETLDPTSLTSLTSLSSAVGLPESHLQKILLAVGASEVDVPLLQCWAFHLRCNSSPSGSL